MTIEQIYEFIMAMAPSIAAVVMAIVSMLQVFKQLGLFKKDITATVDTKGIEKKLAEQAQLLGALVQENEKLKQKINKLVEAETRIKQED